MGAILHHHKRRRLRPYPAQDPKYRVLDKIVLIVAFLMPISTLLQVFEIYYHQNASGVSLLTWLSWLILSIPMFIYGIAHKDKPITIMYSW